MPYKCSSEAARDVEWAGEGWVSEVIGKHVPAHVEIDPDPENEEMYALLFGLHLGKDAGRLLSFQKEIVRPFDLRP